MTGTLLKEDTSETVIDVLLLNTEDESEVQPGPTKGTLQQDLRRWTQPITVNLPSGKLTEIKASTVARSC